jgi:hypothetical protein
MHVGTRPTAAFGCCIPPFCMVRSGRWSGSLTISLAWGPGGVFLGEPLSGDALRGHWERARRGVRCFGAMLQAAHLFVRLASDAFARR